MVLNNFIQITALLFLSYLAFIIFTKKRINNLENNIYKTLIILTIFNVAVSLINVTILKIYNLNILSIIIIKLYLILTVLWMLNIALYIYIVSFKKKEKLAVKNINDLKPIIKKHLFISLIVLFIVLFIKTNYIYENNFVYLNGLDMYFIYGFILTYIIVCFIRLVLRKDYIKKKDGLIIFKILAILLLSIVAQLVISNIMILDIIVAIITFIIYFDINNPDLKLLDELDDARKQVEKTNAEKTDTLIKASHEIRTPLNAIVGFSETLIDKLKDTESYDDIMNISKASKSLLTTLNNILDTSYSNDSKLRLVNTEYNSEIFIKQIIAISKSKFERKDVEFKIDIEKNIPKILVGDSIRLKQIIMNLIENAIKNTKEGYISLKISGIKSGDIYRLIIQVKDTGIGMQIEQLENLFTEDKYNQKMDKEDNLGTDLISTKKLVELMNGKISVESEYKEGSTFRVTIEQKIMMSEETNNEDSTVINDFTGKKLLVVDDDKLNLKVAEKLLSNYNVTIKTISSGQACVEMIKSGEEYDLIFLDDWMPIMTGVETLNELDKIKGFKTPVVALTANATNGMKDKYLKQGFDDYISKPIEREELNRVMNKFLK